VNTSGRDTGRRRPRGYADWSPQAATIVLLEQVAEILAEYEAYKPLTCRQIFYLLVGKYGYEKTERAYDRLSDKLVRARRSRLIPFDAIRDDGVSVSQERWYNDQKDFLEEYARQARGYRRDRQLGNRARIELWSEAAGMLPQLAQVAAEYSIPVYSASGFVSLTAVRMIVDRAAALSVPLVVMHVGDFDPSGESIFDAMTTDAQAFLEEDRTLAFQRIIPVRVALTAEQVAEYELPATPAKKTDSRSARWQHEGTCQLEALAPDDLAVVLENAIADWIDDDMLHHHIEAEQHERTALLRALPSGETA
jgi:hypothetical protein